MVVVSILAILAAIAAPSFTPIIERWQVRQATEELQSTLYYARSEALKRGGNITMQKISSTSGGCSGADNWNCGWFICVDSNANGCTATEPVLQRNEVSGKVEITRSTSVASIRFNRWGLVDGNWPGFSIVPSGKTTADPAARGVCMSSGGRVRIIPPEEIPC